MYSWALNTRWAMTEKDPNNLSFFCHLSLKGKGRGLMLQAVSINTIKCTFCQLIYVKTDAGDTFCQKCQKERRESVAQSQI